LENESSFKNKNPYVVCATKGNPYQAQLIQAQLAKFNQVLFL
jgi:hypothetical protein